MSVSDSVDAAADNSEGLQLPLYMLPPDVWFCPALATSATDVWSFGILLWELFTAGSSPVIYMKEVMRSGRRFDSFMGK
jgi:serine/threonine protein kinase